MGTSTADVQPPRHTVLSRGGIGGADFTINGGDRRPGRVPSGHLF